jgi:serine/threonine-protein kinase
VNPERYQQIARLYHAALELTSGARAAFLDQACAGDAELRRAVESLIASDEQATAFIEAPALEVAAELLAHDQEQQRVGRQVGHYQILSLLGAGGMGEVYLAEERLDGIFGMHTGCPPKDAGDETDWDSDGDQNGEAGSEEIEEPVPTKTKRRTLKSVASKKRGSRAK